jgi:hypothetical protein
MVQVLAGAVGVMERGCRSGQALAFASAAADGLQAAPAADVWPAGAEADRRITSDGLVVRWRVERLEEAEDLLLIDVEVGRSGLPPLARLRALRPSW